MEIAFLLLDSALTEEQLAKKCKTTLIARNYHRDLGVANAVFFLAALPINALLFKSWIFWMMDFLSALIITSIFLRRVELEIDHDLVD